MIRQLGRWLTVAACLQAAAMCFITALFVESMANRVRRQGHPVNAHSDAIWAVVGLAYLVAAWGVWSQKLWAKYLSVLLFGAALIWVGQNLDLLYGILFGVLPAFAFVWTLALISKSEFLRIGEKV